MPRNGHSDRATRRTKLLHFLCEELEDQMRRLEGLVQQRIQPAQPHTVPPLEAVEEVQAISPEAFSPEVPAPEIEIVEPESGVLPEEAVPPPEAAEEGQAVSPEVPSPEVPTPAIEIVEPESGVLPEEAVPPPEAVEEVQAISPEVPSPEVPTPAIEIVEPEPSALPEEEEPFGTYAIMTPTLADIYASQGLIKEAISVLEQILQQEPEREDARRRLDDLKRTL